MKTGNQSPKAFFLTDISGKINHANLVACKCLGYTRDELINMSLDRVYLEMTPHNLVKEISQLDPGEPITVEGHFKNKNGKISKVEMRVCLLNSGNNQVIFVFENDFAEKAPTKTEQNICEQMASIQ